MNRIGWFRNRPGTGGTIDDVFGEWINDFEVSRDRTIDKTRRTHFFVVPTVATVVILAQPDALILVLSALTFLVLLAIGRFPSRSIQAGAMALLDIVLIGFVASGSPTAWVALLVPLAAAMSVGWLVSRTMTWALWLSAVVAMGAAAVSAHPPGAAVSLLSMAVTLAALNVNNLTLLGEGRHSVLRVADLVESLPVVVWETEADGETIIRAIGHVAALTGYTPTQWMDIPTENRVHADDLKKYRAARESARESQVPVVSEVRLKTRDGSHVGVREVIRAVGNPDSLHLRGVTLDVTDEVSAREAVDRLAAVVDNQSDPLVVVAPRKSAEVEPTIVHMNPAFARLAQYEGERLSGGNLWEVAPWLPNTVRADLDDMVTTGRASDRDDLSVATPKGTRNFDFEIVPLPDGSAAIQFTDVTDRRHAIELIRHQAFHDPLTALPNRTLLFDRLSQALAAIARDGSSVGLLLFDLNQFKEINDTLGHAYGDQLLTTIATRLALMVRPQDTVARLGGDEFAMVIGGATVEQMGDIAKRAGDEIRRTIEVGGIGVEVAASIGGAVAPMHGDDPHVLLQRADVAMYDAKRSGMPYNLYVPDNDRHSVDRLTLMGELSGLIGDELRVWYQPKIDIRTGHVFGLEALARWQHPRMGLLGPGQFIELCELSGMISQLTFRVLDEALAVMTSWPGQRVAVNVPVRNLYDRTLPEVVARKLSDAGVEPSRLTLEITESEIMEDHRTVVEVLEEIHDLGIGVSIDDFGTGFSSLTHLRRLPIHEIKIDQSFVSGMLDNENDYMIARSIIDLSHNLGHQVVAEGIEDTATLTLLRELGCDIGQGYLFARPGPIERIRNQVSSGPALDSSGILIWNSK